MVKLDSFTAGVIRFLSGITGAVSFWIGLTGRGAAGVVVGAVFLSFIWLDRGSRWDYLAFCPYRRCMFIVDGSSFYHRNRSPFCHSPPHKKPVPRSLMDGEAGCMAGFSV